MRKTLLITALLLAPTVIAAAPSPFPIDTIGQATLPMDGPWQFHPGDNPAWALPDFDDSGWAQIETGRTWEEQGFRNYTGYAWYRRRMVVDSQFNPRIHRNWKLVLYLPSVQNAAEVYWNGRLIGSYGKLPPDPVWYDAVWPLGVAILCPACGRGQFVLGRPESGVLAIRVWTAPYVFFSSPRRGWVDGHAGARARRGDPRSGGPAELGVAGGQPVYAGRWRWCRVSWQCWRCWPGCATGGSGCCSGWQSIPFTRCCYCHSRAGTVELPAGLRAHCARGVRGRCLAVVPAALPAQPARRWAAGAVDAMDDGGRRGGRFWRWSVATLPVDDLAGPSLSGVGHRIHDPGAAGGMLGAGAGGVRLPAQAGRGPLAAGHCGAAGGRASGGHDWGDAGARWTHWTICRPGGVAAVHGGGERLQRGDAG